MSTHLYLASAASGKTHWVIDALRENAAGLCATPIAVVATPLQAASLRARLAAAGGALGVHILTFDELYVLLLGHCGGIYTELAEPVCFRLLRGVIAAAEAAGRLPFYAGLASSAGFVHIVQGLIGLFKGATITPEALAAAMDRSTGTRFGAGDSVATGENRPPNFMPRQGDPGDDARLHELALLYGDYQRLLQRQGWSDRAGMGWLALEAVEGCDQPLPASVRRLIFDGFDDFTQIQLQVIAALAAKLPQVIVTLTGDIQAANGEVAARPEQRLYIRTARRLCAALQVRAEPLPAAQPAPQPQVEMIEATNQAAEVRAALRWLKQRIVQDGCRAEEVALLARSLQPYRATVVQVAAEFGIPLRILDGLPLAQNPAVAALLDLLRLALPAGDGSGLDLPRRGVIEAWRSPYFDWGGGDVLTGDMAAGTRFGGGEDGRNNHPPAAAPHAPTLAAGVAAGVAAKQGMGTNLHADLRRGEADLLMDVALDGRVIRGEGQWREALAHHARRNAAAEEDAAGDEIEGAAAHRAMRSAALTAQFDRFVAAITPPPAATTFADFTRWLEQLIGDDGRAGEQAEQAEIELSDWGERPPDRERPPDSALRLLACVRAAAPETAGRDLAALAAFKDVLRGLIWAEQAAAQLGETPPPVSYAQFLDELAGTVNVAHYQPPTPPARAVLVATAAQARGVPLAAVAVLGLAEGEFPARISEDPFLRDADRLRLSAQGLPLELSTVSYERELFADCLARASRRLLLTRPRLAAGGAEWEPSPFWREQCQARALTPLRLSSSDLTQPPASLQELVARLAQQPAPSAAALAWLQAAQPGRWGRVQQGALITLARRRRQPSPYDGDLTPLAPALAAAYSATHVWSPSRLESYLTCGFMFFAGSVLRFAARAEPEAGLNALQLGDIYHHIFEQVYRSAANPGDLSALQAAAPAIAARVLADAPQEFGLRATAWWAQECAAIQERVQQTLAGLHAGGGDRYLPIAFEQRFGSGGSSLGVSSAGETFYVRGMIDRVDRHVETGKLRVIDYKTGSSGFDPGGLRSGKKLQLPLYALAAQEALNLGEVQEGFYWLINRSEPSSLQLSRWPGGPAEAIAAAAAHVRAAAEGVRAGHFAGHAPADGCPSYCPAAAFCPHYREW